jgi:predicted permease
VSVERWLYIVRLRARSLFRRSAVDRELQEELLGHIERRVEEHVAKGWAPTDARREALRAMGGLEQRKEECRDTRGVTWIDDLLRDVRYGARMAGRSPGLTVAAVLSLALAIGSTTAVFTLVDTLLLRKLPVPTPDRLVFLAATDGSEVFESFSYARFERLRAHRDLFADLSASWIIDRTATDESGMHQVRVALASGNYFDTLGVKPALGRVFSLEADSPGTAEPVAIISHALWTRRFGHAADVTDRRIALSGASFDIVGVMPPGFTGEWAGKPVDLWIPFMMASRAMPETGAGAPRVTTPTLILGRLQADTTAARTQATLQVVYQQMLRDDAGPSPPPERVQQLERWRIELVAGARGHAPRLQPVTEPLVILLAIVVVVLLIACANVANLLLVRASARQREIAVRLAIGAGRSRLVRQLLTESVLLAAMAGVLGLMVAIWGIQVLTAVMSAGPPGIRADLAASVALDPRLDLRFFTFVGFVCLSTGILFGLAPAIQSPRVSLAPTLTGRTPHGNGRSQFGPGRSLVVAQIALSLGLLIAGGLFLRSLHTLRTQDLGYDREHVLLVWISPTEGGRPAATLVDFADTVERELSRLPGVLAARVSNGAMLDGIQEGGRSEFLKVEGRTPKPGLITRQFAVSAGFLAASGMTLTSGRDFSDRDTDTSPPVAIINRTLARFLFGEDNPVGRRFGGARGDQIEIVGVVHDGKIGAVRASMGVTYVPVRQNPGRLRGAWCIAVRTAGPPAVAAETVQQSLRRIDPNLPILRIQTIDDQLDDVLVQERLVTLLSTSFGLLAVLLATIGVYGVMSYTVGRRIHEIGIRLALGATRTAVMGSVMKDTAFLVVTGMAIGVAMPLACGRLISNRLYQISAADPPTYTTAALAMVVVCAAAGYLPARRAARVDPMVSLRCE